MVHNSHFWYIYRYILTYKYLQSHPSKYSKISDFINACRRFYLSFQCIIIVNIYSCDLVRWFSIGILWVDTVMCVGIIYEWSNRGWYGSILIRKIYFWYCVRGFHGDDVPEHCWWYYDWCFCRFEGRGSSQIRWYDQ